MAVDPAVKQSVEDLEKMQRAQRALADVYTFVRSQEITRAIGAFTLDHYIDEAKRAIKGVGRQIVDAAGQPISTDVKLSSRPSQLQYLDDIEKEFNDLAKAMQDLAAESDKSQQ